MCRQDAAQACGDALCRLAVAAKAQALTADAATAQGRNPVSTKDTPGVRVTDTQH